MSDYYGPRLVADTWQSLIESAHEEVLAQQRDWEAAGRPANDPEIIQPPLPYEHVMNKVQDIAHRTSLNDHVFPIDVVLTMLCRYTIEQAQDETIGADPTWPILLFATLGVAHASIARVLERILDAQEAPFTGRRRKVVVRWINEAVARWVQQVRTQGNAGGIGVWVTELLQRCYEALEEINQLDDRAGRPRSQDTQAVLQEVRDLQMEIQNILPGRGSPWD